MICSLCDCDFSIPRGDHKFFDLGTPQFCSIECFRRYIFSLPPKRPEDFFGVSFSDNPLIMEDATSFSPLLGTSFRSDYERIFAEVLNLSWNLNIAYEPFTLRLSSHKTYTPDFYWLSRGVWFEVKGEWRSGAKKKFLHARDILGERLILVPPTYRKWFVKECNRLHRGML